MKLINTILLMLIFGSIQSQVLMFDYVLNGGVTGNGFNGSFQNDLGIINVHIEPNSTIKKAFLFSIVYQNPPPMELYLNGNSIHLDPNDAVSSYTFGDGGNIYTMRSLVSDVTNIIDSTDDTYVLVPPQNQPFDILTYGGYAAFYLYVLYENPLLPQIYTALYLNDKNAYYTVNYLLNNLNPIEESSNVAFTFSASDICNVFNDGSYVKVNNNTLGLIGGQEDNTNWVCTGSKGSFYFQNQTTYGIGNDTADEFMSGSDVLANIESYLTSTTSINITFDYQQGFSGSFRSNPIHQLLLAYTTTCDTFSVSVPNDTTICSGESLQLNVTGGQSYEWSSLSSSSAALADLSCIDCPNPVFSGDTSRFYTVRIWNNDSCSVVRPIKINVRPKPTIASLNIQASECGTASGNIQLNVSSGSSTPVSYTLNGTSQSENTFNGLASDSYTLSFTDANGCVSKDTIVFIPEVISAIANFTVSPDHGVSPLMVSISNESINATDYLWSINSTDYGNTLSSFTFDTSGVYTIELVAWQYDPSCTDTFFTSINVIESLIIPTMITPNDDGKNDEWILQNIDQLYPENEVVIFNRWGSIVFESEKGKYEIKPWDGTHKGKNLPMGTYFYNIRTGVSEPLKGYVSVLR